MPGTIDKLLLNRGGVAADTHSLNAAFDSGLQIAMEIEEAEKMLPGIMKRAHKEFTAKQEALCQQIDDCLAKAIADQRERNDAMRIWLDNELGLNSP